MVSSLDMCTEPQHDESLNAASTSHNFLMHGTYCTILPYRNFIQYFIVDGELPQIERDKSIMEKRSEKLSIDFP